MQNRSGPGIADFWFKKINNLNTLILLEKQEKAYLEVFGQPLAVFMGKDLKIYVKFYESILEQDYQRS